MEEKKMSFFVKEGIPCPICKTLVYKEEVLTGRGRFIAKDLTRELRREYEPIQGRMVIPFMYSVSTCPQCLISLFNADWSQVKFTPEQLDTLSKEEAQRRAGLMSLFKQDFQFDKMRTPLQAAAAYYLLLMTAPHMPPKYSPATKVAIASVRLYWLAGDFVTLYPKQADYWKGVHQTLQARVFQYLDAAYTKILEQKEELSFFGPDTDRNNGFEGLVYLHHYFQYCVMLRDNPIAMEQTLKTIKRDLSRVFSVGKPSKERPSVILDLVRRLYDDAKKELDAINASPDPEDL